MILDEDMEEVGFESLRLPFMLQKQIVIAKSTPRLKNMCTLYNFAEIGNDRKFIIEMKRLEEVITYIMNSEILI